MRKMTSKGFFEVIFHQNQLNYHKEEINIMSGYVYFQGNDGSPKIISSNDPIPTSPTGNFVKLLDTATVIGRGISQDVKSFRTYVFEVWGTASSFTLRIEATGPSGTARVINKVWDELNNTFLSSSDITAAGFFSVSVPAFTNIQVNVTAISGGYVNVNGGLMP